MPLHAPLEPWRIVVQILVIGGAMMFAAARPLPTLRIVALSMAAGIFYGVCQDQISARLCPEYFTVAHQPIEGLEDPTLLGLAWGFLGSWWGGLFLGLPLSFVSTLGPAPPLSPGGLVRPLMVMLGVTAGVTITTAVSVLYITAVVDISLGEPWASAIPGERHRTFFVVACYHVSAYLTAVVSGIGLCVWAARHRHSAGRRNAS